MSPGRQEGRGARIDQVRMIDPDASETPAGNLFKRAWWAIALRGVVAIVLGIVMLTYPGLTLAVFVSLVGAYLFCDGIITMLTTFQAASHGRRWAPYLIEGLASVLVGIYAFARPSSALFFLVMLLAIRALVVGVVEIGTGFSIRRSTGRSPWLLWLAGAASLAFGLLLFGRPGVGVLALVWTVGLYAIVFGMMLEGEAFRLKDFTSQRLVTT
jgi:uncharacterized membrane protein HdeD (DUF308 family)